ncbi:RHS repeat-associated core domain-containing protein [Pseudomonas putida]|uniref:RHS repeat-associated core domain-containing protein n=1 Tax=Pseudomonas putida TaxID=303 RepID=UPI001E543FAE|nr:RHS repeat-associated core domain-containing protein [Pseudomonas putida]MCC9009473.1 RHS repeat-associated core domain-containing protein [Pseudomonas putida]MCI1040427.1 RHS repeat-associated core domain-containing protein [Pseudomonas putida]
MAQNRKQRLFYKNGQLSSEIGNGQSVTLFSASNTPLAERSAETTLLAENSQSSIVNSSSRNSRKYLSYTAYGHGHTDLILGYTGQRYDRLTNCYHLGNGYRAFSPQIMRFLSPDSLSPFRNRTLNAYAYCMGDPINRHDPSGHTWKAIKASITQAGKAVRTLFKKQEPDYRAAATAAIETNAELKAQYGFILGHPDAEQKHFKALARIPEHNQNIKSIKDAGTDTRRHFEGSESLPINVDELDNTKYLAFEEQLRLEGSYAKIARYTQRLDKLKPQPLNPQEAGPAIRESWEKFDD